MAAPVVEPMRLFASLLLAALLASSAHAQVNEVGLTGGLMYYIGDLNPNKHYPEDMKLGGGLVFRHNLNNRLALRFQGLYGTLEAFDSKSDDPLQQMRNLHFRSRLFEAAALFEINFFTYRGRSKEARRWTPFIFGGLCYFRANPQTKLDDTWYSLQPLGTEGQGTSANSSGSYKVDQIGIPFGAGMKFSLSERLDLQVEWGLRRTYTDHIDDVSGTYADHDILLAEAGPLTAALADRSGLNDPVLGYSNAGRARGNSNTRDWYQYTGLTLTYIISRFSDCDEQYNWMRRKR